MESEQTQNFNERLNQWVASQGFWFQVRYSMTGGGSRSVVIFHLLRVMFRVLIFLVVVALGGVVFLVRLPKTARFQKKIETSISTMLGASESQMAGFARVQGEMLMSRFVSKGGNETFYSSLEARDIKCQMGLFNSLPGGWDPGVLSINRLDVLLNAGADDEKSAGMIGDSLFRDFGKLKLETLEVKHATLRWGYSERTQGKIAGSHMKAQRVSDGWRLHLTGGLFSQTWLRRLEIVEIVANCTRAGVVLEKAEFRKGAGRVSMDGLKVVAGQRPEVKGQLKLSKMALDGILPVSARDFLEGNITGDFRVFGSTNSTDGIGLDGKLVVDTDNVIKLRDRVYLLRALTEFDVFNNYRMVQFKDGSMRIKTQGGGLVVSEVKMKAGDLMTLSGQMRVRFPTPEEAAAAVRRNRAGEVVAPSAQGDNDKLMSQRLDDPDFTLRRAAREAHRDKSKAGGGAKDETGSTLLERMGQSFETRILAEQAAERESRSLMYEGQFQITLLPDTFENVQALREMFPVDPLTGRIPLDVPVKGDIYSITFDQTEDLYLRGQRN